MICPPCAKAGRMVSNAKTLLVVAVAPVEGTSELFLSTARAAHIRCQAPDTCACQHGVTLEALKG